MPATAWLPPVRVCVRVKVRVQVRGLGRYIYILVGRDSSFLFESRLSLVDFGGLKKKNWPMCHMTIF